MKERKTKRRESLAGPEAMNIRRDDNNKVTFCWDMWRNYVLHRQY